MFVIIINLLSIYYNVYIDYKSNYRIANKDNKKSESDRYWFKAYEKVMIEFFMIQWLSEQLKDKIQILSWFEIYSNKSYEIEFYCLLMKMKLLRKWNYWENSILLFNYLIFNYVNNLWYVLLINNFYHSYI